MLYQMHQFRIIERFLLKQFFDFFGCEVGCESVQKKCLIREASLNWIEIVIHELIEFEVNAPISISPFFEDDVIIFNSPLDFGFSPTPKILATRFDLCSVWRSDWILKFFIVADASHIKIVKSVFASL